MTAQPFADQFDESSPRYFGWRVVAALFLVAVAAWGFGFYGQGVYLAEFSRRFGWPVAAIAGASTVFYLVSAFLTVFISDALARFGPRLCVLFGVVCYAVSTASLAFADTLWQLYATYLVMALGWTTMSIGAITNIVSLWFSAKRGLAISLSLTGASCGAICIVPSLIALIGAFGFAKALLIAPAVMAAILVPLTLVWIHAPAVRRDASGAQIQALAGGWTRARALKSWPFWSITLPFSLAWLAQAGFLVHQIAFLEPVLGRTEAGLAVAATTAASVIGGLTLGTVLDRLNQRLASTLAIASQVAALFVMTQTTNAIVLFAACALFGLSVRNVITFPALIVQREFEAPSFGLLIGLSTAISQFVFAFGPGLIGLVRDWSGGYRAALLLCVALDLVAAAIVLRPPTTRL
ncbi:MAG TPA: MFS transporter [Xanthobacteraceae bacterium]